MSSNHFDIIILGAGALGVSCAYELSKSGQKIALIDQFTPPHSKGSSFGETRLFRQAYFEDERYIPFLKSAYQHWRSWEDELKSSFLYDNGYLTLFNSSSDIAQKMHKNAKKWNISGFNLDAKQVQESFPQFQNDNNFSGYLEKNAGMLDVEIIFEKCLQGFSKAGGVCCFNETVMDWKEDSENFIVQTQKEKYHCGKIIFTPGAWLREMPLLTEMKLTVKRGVQFWFPPPPVPFPKEMPCFAFALDKNYVFGFPPLRSGIKIANYHPSDTIEDLSLNRETYTSEEFNSVHNIAHQFFPWLPSKPSSFHVCMYTLTQDEDFILDYLPNNRNILILGGASGHAFKFIPFLAKQVSVFFPSGNDIPQELRFFSLR